MNDKFFENECKKIIEGGNYKYDDGKVDYTLLEWSAIEELAKVRMFGVEKYKERDSWKKVEPFSRYEAAALRHLIAYLEGEKNDKESGLSHLAHVMCNCMFLLWRDKKELEK